MVTVKDFHFFPPTPHPPAVRKDHLPRAILCYLDRNEQSTNLVILESWNLWYYLLDTHTKKAFEIRFISPPLLA